jgi:hypothetical protein
MPLWVIYLLFAFGFYVLAEYAAPHFPGPLEDIAYWGGWIGVLVCGVLAVVYFIRWIGARSERAV